MLKIGVYPRSSRGLLGKVFIGWIFAGLLADFHKHKERLIEQFQKRSTGCTDEEHKRKMGVQ